ncbi:MAG: FAD-dependent oxidoreductase [Phycisphaerae bacterium]|nr:FAD-dependent oxidoreductase [Phycisphaerae bacterium]
MGNVAGVAGVGACAIGLLGRNSDLSASEGAKGMMPGSATIQLSYDVVVVGGGMAGMTAALAAAKNGAKTLLVERYPYCGGAFTAGMVIHIAGLVDHRRIHKTDELTMNPRKWIVQGLAVEYHERLSKFGATHGPQWDHEPAKIIFDAILADYGVDVLYGTHFHAAKVGGGGRIESVELIYRTAKVIATGKVFVDGSGDGDLAAAAGAKFDVGRDSDHRMQPATLSYMVADVLYGTGENLNGILRKAWEEDKIPKDIRPAVIGPRWAEGKKRTELWCSIPRQWGDFSDPIEYSKMERRARAIGWEIFRYLKANTKALSDAYLGSICQQVWPREGRRVRAGYTLTADDVRHEARFEDVVARGAFYLDLHSVTPGTIGWDLDEHRPKMNTYFDIPYRSILPVGVENLLLAGRMLGSTQEAYSATRVMGTGIATGQAAGTAAALAVRSKRTAREVPIKQLQETLRSQGVVI